MPTAQLDLDPVVANLITSARKHQTPLVVLDDSVLRFGALSRLITALAYHSLHGSWAADGSPTITEPSFGPVAWAPRHARNELVDAYPVQRALATATHRHGLRLQQKGAIPELPLAIGYDKHSALYALQLALSYTSEVNILTRDRPGHAETPTLPTTVSHLLHTHNIHLVHVEEPLLHALERAPRDMKATVKKIANYELTRAEFLRALDYNTPLFAARLRELVPTRGA